MDHNLGDSLNLDNSMGVDFEHPEDAVVGETDITLDDSGHDQGIPMEFEHIEEQPILMDTGGEEIIDFIGEQFTLQEYAEHEDQTDILTASMDSDAHNILTSQSDTVVEIEASPHVTTKKQDHTLPKMVTVKTPFSPPRANEGKKNETAVHSSAPRQVPIAPKPPTIPHGSKSYMQGKQFAIAPKPIALLTGQNNSFLKKVTLTGVMQGNKGNPVLTQIGKQLLMMPTTGPQKLKLLTTGTVMPTVQYIRTSTGEQAQMMQTKNVAATHNKPVITKLLLPGQQNMEVNNPQTILTKVTPVSSAKQSTAQFVTMQPKTVPLTLGNKVLLATPTKSGVKFAKKQQIISFKSPEKVSQTAQGPATKKVLITSNPSQNVILKTTAPPKAQITKDGNIIVEGQRTQLHQINVPGKGIQYIRLVTNSNPVPVKPKLQPQTINIPAKTFLLTDTKGNLIQMAAEKPSNSGQPPPMVILGNNSGTLNQISTSKPQQKLVRIAPLVTKAGQSLSINRSSQSLLAPLSPMSEVPQSAKDFASDAHDRTNSKSSLSALVADALRGEGTSEEQSDILNEINVRNKMHGSNDTITEVEVEFKRDSYSDCEDNNDNMDRHDGSSRSEKHPLIVIPSNFMKETDGMNTSDSQSGNDDPQKMNNILNMDTDLLNIYQSPRTPQPLSDSDIVPTELGLRPRKACNCTKSQCLKLYCECFANGEFCNRCNCTNCHNNLDNEERRQKAIRGCLDRNPNAFRPKIGKAKVGGPENVRRHNKGCNCKRSGCLKNYCECYEAKIACTSICKCVGCRNVEETMERARRRTPYVSSGHALYRPPPLLPLKQPCSFITSEVIEAVCQCLLAAGSESVGGGDGGGAEADDDADPVRDVIDEFARCLQDIISASHQSSPLALLEDV